MRFLPVRHAPMLCSRFSFLVPGLFLFRVIFFLLSNREREKKSSTFVQSGTGTEELDERGACLDGGSDDS